MLTFTSLGKTGIRIVGAGRNVSVFTEQAKESSDLLLLSSPEEEPKGDTISWPGEYDMTGITIRGIGHEEGQQVSYLAIVDGVRCAFLSVPLRDWSEAQLERLGDIDLLILPAQDGKIAQKLVDDIDPRILILTPDEKGKIDPDMLKSCGAQGKEHVKEFKLKGALPAEGREVVVFGE